MRKKGLIILLVIIAIFAVIMYFARDRYFERGLEKAIQAVAGAKVEIDNFHFSLFKMECSWKRLQVADKNYPWTNILETGRASFDMETRPLFWRRVIIDEMVLENVRSGSKRTTDGSLPKKKVSPGKPSEPGAIMKAKNAVVKQIEQMPIFDLSGLTKKLNIDSLIDVDKLASVQEYKKLNQVADSTFNYWKTKVTPAEYSARVKKLEDNFQTLKLDEIKDVASLTEGYKKLKNIQQEVQSLRDEVTDQHKALKNTFAEVELKVNEARTSVEKDINWAKSMAKLKGLDVKDVSLLLFGAPVVQRVEKILGYVALGRKYLAKTKKVSATEKKESPPRLKGQNIYFPFHYSYPRFLIRRAKISVATAAGDTSRAYFIEGTLNGLTNEPDVYKRPTRFNLNFKKIDGNQYDVRGSLDHITDEPRDSLWLSASNFGLGKIKLKKGKYFPQAVQAKKGDITLAGYFIDDMIDMKMQLDASPVNFMYEAEAKDRIERIVRDVLGGLNQLKLTTQLVGEKSDYKLRMNSNVDKLLANQVQQTLEKNLQDAQRQVEEFVRAQSDKYRLKAETLIAENRQRLLDEVDKVQQQVQEQVDRFEKKRKEVEDRIEKEKNKLGDDAKKKLKDLFKKP